MIEKKLIEKMKGKPKEKMEEEMKEKAERAEGQMALRKTYRNPLNRHILIGCMIFIVVLCISMGLIGFYIFQSNMMEQYRSHLRDIMKLTMARIDVEDLEQCMETGLPTGQYQELTDFMDQVRQNDSLDYLVIIRPLKEGEGYDVMQVASGLLAEERKGENMRDFAIPLLGDRIGDYYPPEFMEVIYDDMLNRHDIKFSISSTEFGRTYDAATAIRNSRGRELRCLPPGSRCGTLMPKWGGICLRRLSV